MVVALSNYINVKANQERRHRKNPHVVFKHRRNIAVTLPPEVEDKLGLVPDLDYAIATLEGSEVRLRFHRKGATE